MSSVSRLLDAVGLLLIAVGVLLLAFTAYQLWGTGIEQARSQDRLAEQFATSVSLPASSASATTVPAPTVPATGAPDSPSTTGTVPRHGDAVGRMQIPSIGVDEWMVAGARLDDLEKGPGVFAGSVLPGQTGNFAVAGHRTSYGAPFGSLDKLREGDDIIVTTADGEFTYKVTDSRIVPPSEVSVLAQVKDRAIATLVTCHPKWTSKNRLIVTAELAPVHTPALPTPLAVADYPGDAGSEQITPGWLHDRSRIVPTAAWSAALVAMWVAARRFGRGRVMRRATVWSVWALASVPSLYVMFDNLSGLLPANL